jgi:uncharacterized membrane protein
MAKKTRFFLIGLLVLGFSTAASANDAPSWMQLSIPERTALTPIAYDWDHLPAEQRLRLLKVVKEFAKLSPTQQEIFYARLKPWTQMTPAQRDAARDNFKKLRELPKPEQAQIKRLWTQTVGSDSPPANPGR